MNALTREQVRTIDRYAIEHLGVSGVVLMENAGRNAADRIEFYLQAHRLHSVAVVAGAGNNGGDGYVIARHLVNRGYEVTTFLLAPEEKITGDARTNLDILRQLRHDVRSDSQSEQLSNVLPSYDLIVDAVGGTGIRGSLRGDLADVVEQINATNKPVIAVDIPTGLDCDTGEAEGPCVRAEMTITFVARKQGFENPDSHSYTGSVTVADIGIDGAFVQQLAGGG